MEGRRIVLLVTLAILLQPATRAVGAAHQILATVHSRSGNLVRTEMTVQAGANPLAQLKMIRLAKDVPAARLVGSVFFLPPLEGTFGFYEQRDVSGATGTSIAEFFALRNYDVYGLSPRFEGIPAGTCEAGVLDCSVMADWGLESMVDDAAFVRSQIELLHPGTAIAVGGASLGAMLGVAVVNSAPGDYDGVIVWEGMLSSRDPAVMALNQGYCASLEAQLAAGIVFDGVGGNVLRQVAQHAELAPGGLTPIPLFPPVLTNHEVLVGILSVPSPGPVTMPVPGYVQMNGSLAEDRFFFASERRVYELFGRSNAYLPNALARDISCALAGLDDQHVANLVSFAGAVLALGGSRGFGDFMQDQLDLFGTDDVTFILEPELGHLDHFMTRHHRRFVEFPILRWLRRMSR